MQCKKRWPLTAQLCSKTQESFRKRHVENMPSGIPQRCQAQHLSCNATVKPHNPGCLQRHDIPHNQAPTVSSNHLTQLWLLQGRHPLAAIGLPHQCYLFVHTLGPARKPSRAWKLCSLPRVPRQPRQRSFTIQHKSARNPRVCLRRASATVHCSGGRHRHSRAKP